jgi:Family of unknown function (DUF5678)
VLSFHCGLFLVPAIQNRLQQAAFKMAPKRPLIRRPAPLNGARPRRGASTRLRGPALSRYPIPPIELAGKWVAWSRDREIIAAGETLAEVMAMVESRAPRGASYELLPRLDRGHGH